MMLEILLQAWYETHIIAASIIEVYFHVSLAGESCIFYDLCPFALDKSHLKLPNCEMTEEEEQQAQHCIVFYHCYHHKFGMVDDLLKLKGSG